MFFDGGGLGVNIASIHCKQKKYITFTVKNYRNSTVIDEQHFRFYGFNLNLQLNTVISLTEIMLTHIIEVLKSVLYL